MGSRPRETLLRRSKPQTHSHRIRAKSMKRTPREWRNERRNDMGTQCRVWMHFPSARALSLWSLSCVYRKHLELGGRREGAAVVIWGWMPDNRAVGRRNDNIWRRTPLRAKRTDDTRDGDGRLIETGGFWHWDVIQRRGWRRSNGAIKRLGVRQVSSTRRINKSALGDRRRSGRAIVAPPSRIRGRSSAVVDHLRHHGVAC